jgi:succinyl-CoA synthetase beta subunit
MARWGCLAMASSRSNSDEQRQAANILDIGEGEKSPRIRKGMNLIVKNTAVKVVLTGNVLAGDFVMTLSTDDSSSAESLVIACEVYPKMR